MVAPVIFSGNFAGLLSTRGVLTKARNECAFNGARNYLPGQFQDFVVANDVATLAGSTANRTTNTTKWRQSAAALIALETTTPLTPTQSIKITVTGTDQTQFVETPMFTLDRIDYNGNVYFSFETEPSGTFAVNDIDIIAVNYNSSGTYVAQIAVQGLTVSTGFTATGGGQIPASKTIVRGFFVATSTTTDQYSLRFRSGNAAARSLVIGDYLVGPTLSSVPSVNVIGKTDGVTQTIGRVGQVISTAVTGSTNAAASGSLLALRSVDLTPGCWLLSANSMIVRNGATLDQTGDWLFELNPNPNSSAGAVPGLTETVFGQTALSTGSVITSASIANAPINLSSNQTYYLNVSVTYSAGTPKFYGNMVAVRIA